MEQQSSTKTYLKLCYEQVVDEALENGLDEECYYSFLCEIFRALPGDTGVRRKVRKMLKEAEGKMAEKFSEESDSSWQNCYAAIFNRQDNFMIDLMSFACASITDEDTLALSYGILNFVRIQLHAQKRHMDTVERYANLMSQNAKGEKIRKDLEFARKHYEPAYGIWQSSVYLLDTRQY